MRSCLWLPPVLNTRGWSQQSDVIIISRVTIVQEETPPAEMFIVPKHYEEISEAYLGQETREMLKTAKSSNAAEKEVDEHLQ